MEHQQNRDPWERRGIEGVTGQPGVPDWTVLSPYAAVFRQMDQPIQGLTPLQWYLTRAAYLLLSIQWQRPAFAADLYSRLISVTLWLRQQANALSSRQTHGPTPMSPG